MDRTCSRCGNPVTSTIRICPKCGSREFREPSAQQSPQPHPATYQPPATKPAYPKLLLWGGAAVAVALLAVGLIGYSIKAKAEAEIRKQEAMDRLELERKQKELELELERKRREDENNRAIEKSHVDEESRQRQETAERRAAAEKDAIRKMEIGRRSSLYNKNMVLQLRNLDDVTIDFQLKCCTTSNDCKTMFVTIAPRSEREIGFLEGWNGNFVSGESCEARFQDETLRRIVFD